MLPFLLVPIWEREFESQEELVTEFARECRIVRKGLNGDLKKAMKDGKPIIIEGIHLDPSIYLMDEECSRNASPIGLSVGSGVGTEVLSEEFGQLADPLAGHNEGLRNVDQEATALEIASFVRSADKRASEKAACPVCEGRFESSAESFSTNRLKDMNHVNHRQITGDFKDGSPAASGESVGDPLSEKQRQKISAKAIIVPIILKMDEFDHKTLLEEWIACRSITGALSDEAKKEALINKLMTIQDYLCSFKNQGIVVRNVSATTFPQTLDALHSSLLQRIEECQNREKNRAKGGKEQS